MKKRAGVVALMWVVIALSTAHGEEINPVVGKAGDFILREADMERLIDGQPAGLAASLRNDSAQRASFVKQLLQVKAIAARARKEKFDRKPEIREQMGNVIDQYLAQEYVARTVSEPVAVTEDELKAYYREHAKELEVPESVTVRQIFIACSDEATLEQRAKAKAKAAGILEQLGKGADFAKLAREQSEDDTAAKGGALGTLTPGKTNSPDFEKAVFALKAGETSKIIQTPFGLHIVKVEERRGKRTATFQEARDQLHSLLLQRKKQQHVEQFLDQIGRESGLEVKLEQPVEGGKK